MYTLENINISPLRIPYTLLLEIIPLLTLTLVHMWYQESTSRVCVEITLWYDAFSA